ncbi:MAG: glucosaminidase domain-containing protein [Treponema sp.]|nr:glucosaminidase domain-containing protein [Treponema sp.]
MKHIKGRFVTLIKALCLLGACFFVLWSCKTVPEEREDRISRLLLGPGILTSSQLADFFIQNNPDYDYNEVYYLATLYKQEAALENINSDLAFAQMCHETGFLRFGNLVQPEWHNYCGLGAISPEQPGCQFETAQLGVRAHIQHLQAYATTEEVQLNSECVDPRYSWVHKTKYAQTLEEMAASWAADPDYAKKLNSILIRMEDSIL